MAAATNRPTGNTTEAVSRARSVADANSDADVRFDKDRSVVEAVADHRDRVAGPPMPIECDPLVFRGQSGAHVLDPQGGRDPMRRRRKVPGQHGYAQAAGAQRSDRRPRFGNRRIVERDHGASPLAPADIDHRMTARLRGPPALGQSGRDGEAQIAHQSEVACGRRSSVAAPDDAASRHGANIARGDQLDATVGRCTDHGTAEAMFGMAFQPGGPRQHLGGRGAVALDRDDPRLS